MIFGVHAAISSVSPDGISGLQMRVTVRHFVSRKEFPRSEDHDTSLVQTPPQRRNSPFLVESSSLLVQPRRAGAASL
jgi:hypothetical protein